MGCEKQKTRVSTANDPLASSTTTDPDAWSVGCKVWFQRFLQSQVSGFELWGSNVGLRIEGENLGPRSLSECGSIDEVECIRPSDIEICGRGGGLSSMGE